MESIDKSKVIDKAVLYFQRVTFKQGYLIPFNLVYGDGTLYKGLSRAEVEEVYAIFSLIWQEDRDKSFSVIH